MLTEKTLNAFIRKANIAYQQFRVWIYTNNEFAKHQDRWNKINDPTPFATKNFSREKGCKYKNFWAVTISSLQHEWILSMARLFDPAYHPGDKKKGKPRLSLEYITESLQDVTYTDGLWQRIKKYDPTIKSIKDLRDNFLAHNNMGDANIKIAAGTENLFEELDKIISDIKQDKPHLRHCNDIGLEYADILSRCGVEEIFEALLRSH